MKKIVQWAKDTINRRAGAPRPSFPALFARFQEILELNNRVLEMIAEANDKLGGDYVFDQHYIHTTCRDIADLVEKLVYNIDAIAPNKYLPLHEAFRAIKTEIDDNLAGKLASPTGELVIPYDRITRDVIELVGGKNANLAELRTFLGLTIPDGFAITSAAYEAFLEHNGLRWRIRKITEAWLKDQLDQDQASAAIKKLILAGKLPARLEKEINRAQEKLTSANPGKPIFFAVRSSAWGEDSEYSFAGQYLSLLNEPAGRLATAYRRILASAYESSALEYRRRKGFKEDEVAMAVACQVMIDAKASGVLYTLDPLRPEKDNMLLSSAWGLGAPVVSGRVATDRFSISRRPPHRSAELKVVKKETALTINPQGGTTIQRVAKEQQTGSALANDQLRKLAELGLLIEKYFKKPQDVEFAVDQEGEIVILQTRQLAIKPHSPPRAADLAGLAAKYPVLFRDQGAIAQRGIASGPVFVVHKDADLKNLPFGAIMVTRYASPMLAKAMNKVSGIITDVGSVTGHLATIAREFRIPTLLDTGVATERLQTGQEITLDAEENIVYQGVVKELSYYQLVEEEIEETFEYRLLRRVLKKIEPLHLLDPSEANFVPKACRTLHDITRYVHEKAVEEIIDLNYYQKHDPGTVAGKLKWDMPLDLVMIDIGGGLTAEVTKGVVLPEQIISVPMRAILEGLSHPGAWDNEPMSIDMGSFMSSLTRTFAAEHATPKQVGQNLAVVSKEYANISLRLGYHFTMIDAYVAEEMNDNYAYFRFFGGVTDSSRRTRRAKFIGEVLAANDFRIELHGDLVVARVKKLGAPLMRKRLYLLGLLVGFTRQLDVKMISDRHIASYVEKLQTLVEEKS